MTASTRMRLVLLGPPGAGKGTQAALLSRHFRIPHISTGDILRSEIGRGSELGALAKSFMNKGELVPDHVMLGIVRERIGSADCEQGFLLDGFPRSVPQAHGLEEVCSTSASGICVVSLVVPAAEVVARMAGRRTCGSCGAMYHVAFERPRQEGVCDRCGGELYQRADDREEIIEARLEVFRKETEPLLAFYRERRVLVEVDGLGPSAEVFGRVVAGLGTAVA